MLIVGLGNPTQEYKDTYHNVGFMAVESLAEKLNIKIKDKDCKALTGVGFIKGEKIVLAMPQTYMNLSGESIRELVGKYKMNYEDVLVLFDDLDIPCGAIRIRKEGSGGTHNGMKNIVECAKTQQIPRVRLGIGKPQPPMQIVDYVLSKIKGDNKIVIGKAVEKIADGIIKFINTRNFEVFMQENNGIN